MRGAFSLINGGGFYGASIGLFWEGLNFGLTGYSRSLNIVQRCSPWAATLGAGVNFKAWHRAGPDPQKQSPSAAVPVTIRRWMNTWIACRYNNRWRS